MALSKILTIMTKTYSSSTPEHLKIDWEQFTAWFNATLAMYGSAIAPLRFVTKGKRVQAQRIINELGSKQVLVDAVVHMAKSDLCNGRTRSAKFPRGFLASFPWMLGSDERIADLANGKYDNAPAAELTPVEQRQLEQERYRQQQEARRAEARRIEEDEHERRARQREQWAQGAVTYEEYQRLRRNGEI